MTADNSTLNAPAPLFTDAKGRPVAAPDFGGEPVADTHAHLDMLEDPAAALAFAGRAGVGFVATVADPSEDAQRTYSDLDGWLRTAAETGEPPRVRIIVGVHPHNAKEFSAGAEGLLRELALDPRTCAIGEIGLDYHYDQSPRDVQRAVFRTQLELAHELELPAVIHLREAHGDGERIMRSVGLPPAGCVLHCYNLGIESMKPFVEMGCYVSFAGPVTFKKSEDIRQAAAKLPADRVLTETDCPFMAPEPFRGRKNEPAFTVFTAARIAEARGEDAVAFAATAYANALRVFDRNRS
jgi:TatD DNase family protein